MSLQRVGLAAPCGHGLISSAAAPPSVMDDATARPARIDGRCASASSGRCSLAAPAFRPHRRPGKARRQALRSGVQAFSPGTPLLRFLSPSALAGPAALSGFAGLRTIPLRRSRYLKSSAASGLASLLVGHKRPRVSPLRFSARADALRVPTCGGPAAHSAGPAMTHRRVLHGGLSRPATIP